MASATAPLRVGSMTYAVASSPTSACSQAGHPPTRQPVSSKVVRFYNRRGTAEQWIKGGKNAVKWTKLSCRRFKDNAARLQLFALAYNLANALRQLALPRSIRSWTLTTLREKLVKIGAKVVTHAKYLAFQLAEVAVPRPLFAAILERIGRLRLAEASG
jgi:hypothetical protein